MVVHWTAGHRNGLKAGGDFQRSSGMQYLLLDADGNLGQGDPLNVWGYHAGASKYPGVSGTVSDELVGIEVQAAGTLRKHGEHFYPWWDNGKNLPANRISATDVIYSPKRGNIAAGHYHRFTAAQMLAMRRAICWLHLNWPSVFRLSLVVGHDEVSPGRKTDPGAALVTEKGEAMTMPEFRDQLADDVRTIKANR
jgi:N-acetyl-anhydromuramyl-L-alanine amidase AmpD